MGKKPKNCSYLGGYFTSYLLSQLFVTHLGFALLLYITHATHVYTHAHTQTYIHTPTYSHTLSHAVHEWLRQNFLN